MKKRILLLMLIFSILCTGGGKINSLNAQDVTIGSNSTTYKYIPLRAFYKYSVTEQIYKSSDIKKTEGGTITAISFMVSETSEVPSFTRNIKIYIKNTSKSSYSKTQFESWTSNDKYFEGEVNFNKKGEWIDITLDTPFTYEGGTKNILVGIASSNDSGLAKDVPFVVWTSGTKDALYKNSNVTEYDIENMTVAATSMRNEVPYTKFTFGAASTPTAPSFTDLYANPKGVGHFKPYFSFYVENATHYQVLLSTSDDMSNPSYIAGAVGSFVAMTDDEITANQVTLNGDYDLSYNTTYYWQVIARNGEDTEAPTTSSTVYSFTTRNITERPDGISEIAPANNTVITGNPELSWSFGSDTEEYRVLLGTSATLNENDVKIDWTYFPIEVSEASYQTSNLEAGTYYWQVQTRNQIGTNEGTVYSFTKVGAPGNVTSISPADGATEVINTATLSWTFAPYTEEYRVLMDLGEGLEYVTNWIEKDGETAEYTPEGIGGGETVRWCVEVRNASASLELYDTDEENNPTVFTYTTSNFLPVKNISPVNDFRLDGETAILTWNFQGDATHYQVKLGKTQDEEEMDVVLDWTERGTVGTGLVTEGSFETVNLDHNSRYYWQVNVRKGESENTRDGEIASFITILDNPQNVTPEKQYLYYEDNGEVKIYWNQMSGIEGLNIYVGTGTETELANAELIPANQQFYPVTVPTYILNPQTITVKARYAGLGESTGSTTQVEVVGYATVNGTITDDKKQAVKGVTVTYSGTDRVGEPHNIVFTTGADGKYSGTVPVGTYSITAVKEDYSEYSAVAKDFKNGQTVEETITLVNNLAFDIYIRTNTAMELELNLTKDAWYDLDAAPEGYYKIYFRTEKGVVEYNNGYPVMFRNNSNVLYMNTDYDVQNFNIYWANLPNGTYNVGVEIYGKDYINWSRDIERDYHIFMASTNNDWNEDSNWLGGELPGINDDVTLRASVVVAEESDITVADVMIEGLAALTINGTLNANYVTITTDASLVINGILNANEVINQGAIGKLLINDGGQLYRTATTLLSGKFVKNIKTPSNWETTKDGWQLMASPFTNEDQTYTYFTQFTNGVEDYDLYKYNGSELKEWINIKDTESNGNTFGDTFVNGTGYLVAYESTSNVALTGSFKSGTSYTIENLVYDDEKDLANFHLLGNPFPFNMDWNNVKGNRLVEGFAVLNEDGDNYVYKTSGTIKVGEGFFIRTRAAEGTELGEPSFTHSIITRGAEKETVNSLNVIATGNVGKDNVVINFAGESEGFPKLQNFNDAIATVYVQDKGANYGIYNCDENTTEVELCFNANQMGNYTISVEDSEEFETVILVDRFTGIETNMLLEDYTFTAMSDVNNNRFILKLAVSDQQSAVSDNFVYQSGEELIVEAEGRVQIIDVMGRVVYNNDVTSDNNRINVSDFNNGAYVVRVINESEIKVEKVVIY